MTEKCQLFEDVRYAVDHDKYMWIVIWGPPRETKTTIAGHILQSLYKDWNKTLSAFVFNLPQCLFKIRNGLPERWPTVTKPCHMRVPALNYDDFGASSNKAVTQYDLAWDYFKGGFDILGTRIAVLAATMVDPAEPTVQLVGKYTHEILVAKAGHYKYDKVEWQQDFKGWNPRKRKIPIEENTFDPWPEEVYAQYDLVRQDLAEEVLQRTEDACTMSSLDMAIRFCKPHDFKILRQIDERGPQRYSSLMDFQDHKNSLARLKGYGLLVPIEHSAGSYRYAMTPLGQNALQKIDKVQGVQGVHSDNEIYIDTKDKRRLEIASERET